MHKISDEFEFWPDRTTDYGVSCPWLIMGKWCHHTNSFIFDRILIKVAGNQDRHKSSDEIDFGHLVSMAHLYVVVFFNEIRPWHIGLRWAILALWASCLNKGIRSFWNQPNSSISRLSKLSLDFFDVDWISVRHINWIAINLFHTETSEGNIEKACHK